MTVNKLHVKPLNSFQIQYFAYQPKSFRTHSVILRSLCNVNQTKYWKLCANWWKSAFFTFHLSCQHAHCSPSSAVAVTCAQPRVMTKTSASSQYQYPCIRSQKTWIICFVNWIISILNAAYFSVARTFEYTARFVSLHHFLLSMCFGFFLSPSLCVQRLQEY